MAARSWLVLLASGIGGLGAYSLLHNATKIAKSKATPKQEKPSDQEPAPAEPVTPPPAEKGTT